MLIELLLLLITNIIAMLVILVVTFAKTVPLGLRLTVTAMVASLLLWQDSVYISNTVTEYQSLWNSIVFIWPTATIVSFYLFTRQLSAHKKWHAIKPLRIGKYIAATILVAGTTLQLLALLSGNILLINQHTAVLERGWGYVLYVIGLGMAQLAAIIYFSLGMIGMRKSTRDYRAMKVVFYTVLVATLYGVFCNILLPVITGSQTYAALGILTADIFAVGFMFSVVRGQLLDIKLYVIRSVVYILSLATLATIYAIAAFTASQWLFGSSSSSEQTALNIILALLLAFIFQPIKRFFDRITNHLFYRDNYNTGEFYARLSRLLTSTTDLRGLLQRAADEVTATLKAEYGLFFVYDKNHYVMTSTARLRHRLPIQDARAIDDYVEKYGDKVIVTELLTKHDDLRRLLVSHKVCLVLPLQRGNDEIIGYFLMGDHRSSSYTRRDIRVLETIADELVIAIQNALSVQEVKELNATLQQRIDEATKELRASNSQLQKLDEAKDEFVSMASHQLRTPLTSVKGYIDMVLEGDAGEISDMQKHLLGEAFTSSERMVHLINDFLNVSRLQTGKFMIDRRATDLPAIINQEVDGLRTTAHQRQLELNYDLPADFPQLYIDEGKMRQVVMNFIDNAIYYSKEGTTITVSLSLDGDMATMTVKDTGIGVPEDEQAQLFTKFYRASNARKQRPDGTGVGLYLAKKVIVAHGGSMVFSSTPGKGSTFGFTLPVKKLSLAPVGDADDFGN
jgi:signal transduction histidine kinase